MKQTEFRFEVRLTADDPQSTLIGLETKLRLIKGIGQVLSIRSDCDAKFNVHASFEDGEQAKTLHRNVMSSIMTYEGATISRVATTLTDIF